MVLYQAVQWVKVKFITIDPHVVFLSIQYHTLELSCKEISPCSFHLLMLIFKHWNYLLTFYFCIFSVTEWTKTEEHSCTNSIDFWNTNYLSILATLHSTDGLIIKKHISTVIHWRSQGTNHHGRLAQSFRISLLSSWRRLGSGHSSF